MTEVGSAYIDIRGDGSGLPKDVDAAAKRASKGAEVTLKAELDSKGLDASVEKAAGRAEKKADVDFVYKAPDAKHITADVERVAEKAEKYARTQFTYVAPVDAEQAKIIAEAKRLSEEAAKEGKIGFEAYWDHGANDWAIRREANRTAEDAATDVDFGVQFEPTAAPKLRKAADILAAKASAQADPVKLDAKIKPGSAAKVEGEAKAIAEESSADVEFKADPDFGGLSEAAKIAARRARTDVEFNADADFSTLVSRAHAAAKAAAMRVKVTAHLEGKGFKRLADGRFINTKADWASIGELEDALTDLGNTAQKTGTKATGALSKMGPSIAVIGVAAINALPYVTALGAGLVALVGQVAYAAGGLAAGGAGIFASIGLAAASVKVGLTGVGDAFGAVSKAQEEQAKTGKVSEETMKAQKEALKGLAPSAREFVKAIASLKGEWDDLTKAVQQRLFDGLGDEISHVAKNVLPVLQGGLSGAARMLDQAAQGALEWVDALAKSGDLGSVFVGLNGILRDVLDTVGGFGRGLFSLFQGSLPFAAKLAESLKAIGESFADWASGFASGGGLDKFLERAWDAGSELWDILKNVGSILGSLFSGSSDLGSGLLDSLDKITGKFADFLKSDEGQQKMADFFAEMGEALHTIAEGVKAAWPVLQGMLEGATENQDGIKTLVDALIAMGPALKVIGQLVGVLASTAGIFSLWAIGGDQLKESWGGIGEAVMGGLGDLASWAQGTWDSLSTGAQEAVQSVADWFTALPERIGEAVSGLAESVGGWFSGVGESVGAVVDGIVEWFVGLPDRIIEAAGSLSERFAEWLYDLPVLVIEAVTAMLVGFIDLAGRAILLAGDLAGAVVQWMADAYVGVVVGIANFLLAFADLATRVWAAAGDLGAAALAWVQGLPAAATQAAVDAIAAFSNLAGRIITGAGNLIASFQGWVSGLPAAATQIAVNVIQSFANLASRIISGAGNMLASFRAWAAGLPAAATQIAVNVIQSFSNLASKIIKGAGNLLSAFGTWFSGIGAAASRAADTLVGAFKGLAGRIVEAIGTIVPKISLPKVGKSATGDIAGAATGTIAGKGIHMTRGPEIRIIGEAGPEAVVPLNPNGTLNRDVRNLLETVAASRGMFGDEKESKQLPPIQVLLPTGDPEAAAMAVYNRLVRTAY